tara:strand:- start:924 stop:1193 length:270 start_codon:yes stop_codon:yes gene_type:complete
VAGWLVAVLFWTVSRSWKKKAEVQKKQFDAHARLLGDLQKISEKKKKRVDAAKQRHATVEVAIEKKAETLEKATELDDVTDAINASFKE